MSAGIEGLALAEIFCLDTVRLGPFVLHSVPVQIIEEWEMDLPMYVGWTFFRSFDAILSLAHQVVRLKADQAILTADFPKDRSGLAAQRDDDHITIIHVARNSPGWAAGLRDNDVITQIDGQPVSASFPPPGMRIGFQPEGTLLQLGLANGRQIAFRLSNYF